MIRPRLRTSRRTDADNNRRHGFWKDGIRSWIIPFAAPDKEMDLIGTRVALASPRKPRSVSAKVEKLFELEKQDD
jgi:hypothetical protein